MAGVLNRDREYRAFERDGYESRDARTASRRSVTCLGGGQCGQQLEKLMTNSGGEEEVALKRPATINPPRELPQCPNPILGPKRCRFGRQA